MFTGIIADIGTVNAVRSKGGDVVLEIVCPKLNLVDVIIGDSIAINGVCLTVITMLDKTLSFDLSRETLDRSSLGALKTGSSVNLEKALAIGDRLGGHFVSGHVDGLASCVSLETSARSVQFRFEVALDLARFIAEKGSICIDGTSLTVNHVGENWFEVNIIPHTMQETIIQYYRIGSVVNIEVDLLARYLDRLQNKSESVITKETLRQHGFLGE